MSANTVRLLKMAPKDAIIKMLNDENDTRFPSGVFDISEPVAGLERETTVNMAIRKSRSKLDEIPYSGEIDFTFQRLDLAEHFPSVLTGFRPPMPCSTQTLIDEITRRVGQQFFLEDFVLEEISHSNAAPYSLKAKVESLRWFGSIEVTLIDLLDLQPFLDESLALSAAPRLGTLSAAPQLNDPSMNMPFINATPNVSVALGLTIDALAQDYPQLLNFMRANVSSPTTRMDEGLGPWVVSTTPAAFNLYNARVVSIDPIVSSSAVNSNLDYAVVVQLDTNYCTNFAVNTITIPFRNDDYSTSTFTNHPRLTQIGIFSDTDGSPYAPFLNSFSVGHVFNDADFITLSPPWMILTDGGEQWKAVEDVRFASNLFNGVVQYNGQRRPQDIHPVDLTLNRVMTVTMSDLNSAYRGNIAIHYKAPIVLIDTMPPAFFDTAYSVDLGPTEAVSPGPYTFTLVSGGFAPGHTLNASTGVVSGTATAEGLFRPVVRVTASNGVQVTYSYSYTVTIGVLAISGAVLSGVRGSPITPFTFTASGGVGPYSFSVFNLSSIGLNIDPVTGILSGTITGPTTIIGSRSFSAQVEDSRGVTATYPGTMFISGSFA